MRSQYRALYQSASRGKSDDFHRSGWLLLNSELFSDMLTLVRRLQATYDILMTACALEAVKKLFGDGSLTLGC